jgi:hypothetical protein
MGAFLSSSHFFVLARGESVRSWTFFSASDMIVGFIYHGQTRHAHHFFKKY